MRAALNILMELGEKNLHKVPGGGNLVLAEFESMWSTSCQFMISAFDKLSNKYDDKVSFVKEIANVNQGRGGWRD
jgi:thioredoxin 1